jgi:hypothetical protein
MSSIGAVLSRAVGSLGGPGTSAALVAGGLAIGALGGGLAVGLGSGGTAQAAGALPVYGCPGAGSPLSQVKAGQSVLATGRTQDGTWLRIHLPLPGRTEGWVQAAPLQARASLDTLPVATCAPELAIAAPTLGPTATLTVPGNFAPSAPPTAEPTPTPTATAIANAPPALSGLSVSTRTISYDTGGYCPSDPKRAAFKVKATDDAGVTGVALLWRAPGAGAWTKAAMDRVAGDARNGTWQVSIDTTANSIRTAGRLAYYAVATDAAGATRRLPTGGSSGVTVAICRNTGPAITQIGSSSGSSLYWDPLGASNCQTATNITAVVKDADGVKSVTLFYKKPGAGSYASKPMDNTTIRGKWYANLDTLGDGISIKGPPTDGMAWYIRAVDDLGKASTSSTRSLTIRRCDTEAVFGGSSTFRQTCPSNDLWFYGSASDPDGIGSSSATLVYTYVRADGQSSRTKRLRMSGNNDGAWYYSAKVTLDADWKALRASFTFRIETRDRYGGTSRGGEGKGTVSRCG